MGIYRSLLFEILTALLGHLDVLDDPQHGERLNSLHDSILYQKGRPGWDMSALQGLLRSAIENLGPEDLACSIDTLDECPEKQVEGMVQYFEDPEICAVSNVTRFHICFSSRHYRYIDIRYGRKLTLDLQDGHREDLATCFQKKLKVVKGRTAEEVQNEIQVKPGGIFMWIVLVVDILNAEHKNGRIV